MVGAGVFTTSGKLLQLLPSPGVLLLAWVVAGIAALCGAIAARVPPNARLLDLYAGVGAIGLSVAASRRDLAALVARVMSPAPRLPAE